jgi:hypothetical protein
MKFARKGLSGAVLRVILLEPIDRFGVTRRSRADRCVAKSPFTLASTKPQNPFSELASS